jgi:phosphoribosylformylglycinamidine synthase
MLPAAFITRGVWTIRAKLEMVEVPTHRIEVGMQAGRPDAVGQRVRARLAADLGIAVGRVRVIDVYTIHAQLGPKDVTRVRDELLTDPVIQESRLDGALARDFDYIIEVGYLPGVTDNVGKSAAEGIADVLGRPLSRGEAVYKSTQYVLYGALDAAKCDRIARGALANPLIQRWAVKTPGEIEALAGRPLLSLPVVTERGAGIVREINLDVPDEALMRISREGLLALELPEMHAIQAYYRRPATRSAREKLGVPAGPTDIELETLAQTWSEHCKHKIFAAKIRYTDAAGGTRTIPGLFRTYIKETTERLRGQADWLVSVFDDNAGIIRFDDHWNFALKVETHNSPSALDPYGGAITGIVGVNRDVLGAGMGCRCILNTDVFCVASPDYAGTIPERLFHPKRVLRGIHAGVQDGGNQSGIPDVNGAIVFHDRFLGKPLVFCGTGGLIPARIDGERSERKGAKPGDRIVMAGGRIGKDGIHGATFSSEELHEGSPATAVQIGDPITQKKMADFLIEARDLRLFSSITDNGAGGLASSVGEMAKGPGGCQVHLNRAPLKYAGLAPWEIFLSEAQERMTLAVPPDCIEPLMDLARRREVEVTDLGEFTESGLLECFFSGRRVAALEMEFLHNGVPVMELEAKLDPAPSRTETIEEKDDLTKDLLGVLGRLNVCSKEAFVRMYDHEVLGQSVLKQFQGAANDGPGDAAVIRPVPGSNRGLAIACGICPKYSDLDAYAMTAAAVDEAVRNLLCVGARLGTIAGLDNFCWPDPVQSEKTPDGRHKLAQLVRSCEALHEICLAYGIPLISGKDSMKNDYKIGDTKISIPPTMLFTAVGIVPDVTRCVSMDAKAACDLVYVLGETHREMGGSEFLALQGQLGAAAPRVDAGRALALYRALGAAMEKGLVASCHDASDGGLGAALAETAMAGGLGMDLDIGALQTESDAVALFSESQSRFVVTVPRAAAAGFDQVFRGLPCHCVGKVYDAPRFRVLNGKRVRVDVTLDQLKTAWKRPLDW